MSKTLTIPYEEYEEMKEEISNLQEMVERKFDNVLLVKRQIREEHRLGCRHRYYVEEFEDIKGRILNSFKTTRLYESYEESIDNLEKENKRLWDELSIAKRKYKEKGIYECIFG